MDQLNVFGDSQLVINQVNNIYQTRDEKLLPYKHMVGDMKNYFSHITFQKIPRTDNKAADAMATLASFFYRCQKMIYDTSSWWIRYTTLPMILPKLK